MIARWGIFALGSALMVVAGLPAQAEGLSGAHKRLIDGRLSSQFQSRIAAAEEEAATRRRQVFEVPSASHNGPYRSLARTAALQHNIPPDLFARLVTAESAWNPKAISPKGAIGLAQLMPFTARALGVNPRDPRQNLEGGARYLAQQYRRFGSWRLALAAYNAGPEAVEKYGGVPPYRETRNYVKKILGP